jgi:hypothetical protein
MQVQGPLHQPICATITGSSFFLPFGLLIPTVLGMLLPAMAFITVLAAVFSVFSLKFPTLGKSKMHRLESLTTYCSAFVEKGQERRVELWSFPPSITLNRQNGQRTY